MKKYYNTKNDINVFKKLRIRYNLTQAELADKLNIVTSTVSKWETGKAIPDPATLKKISEYFKVSIDYLLGKTELPVELVKQRFNDNIYPIHINKVPFEKIPVLGSIAAGTPIEAIENNDIDDYIFADASNFSNGIYFALRIKGDSMEPRICENDLAVIEACDWVNNGSIAAVRVNGGDTTLKKVKFEDNGIWLIGLNQSFKPIFYSAKECKELPVTVIGKLVQVIQNY